MGWIILDTQILIWYQTQNPHLTTNARSLLLDTSNELVVSAATWWEMAIKISSGKLTVDLPIQKQQYSFGISQARVGYCATRRGISTLPILATHFLQVVALPYPDAKHRDPFDRLIIAQALVENVPVLTADTKRLWTVSP